MISSGKEYTLTERGRNGREGRGFFEKRRYAPAIKALGPRDRFGVTAYVSNSAVVSRIAGGCAAASPLNYRLKALHSAE